MKDFTSLRFLVVEDQGFQRWLVCDLLQRLGALSVDSADDGQSALAALDVDGGVDVVITDLDMPGMDGMRFIRHLGERRDAASLIVLSAQEHGLLHSVEAMARAYGVKVLATIPKPLTAAKLNAAFGSVAPPAAAGREHAPIAEEIAPEELAQGLRDGAFEPYFQPIVEMRTRRTLCAEALVRWRRSGRVISPGKFIEAIEAHGLIGELTMAVASKAITACRQWRSMGSRVGVAINLSASSLADSSLADRMTDLAGASGLEPREVTFELIESAADGGQAAKL